MDYATEFNKYATKHHGVNSMYYDKIISSMYPVNMTPTNIEERQLNAIAMDVFSRLMMDRIIFMGTGINDQVANIVQAQLLFLESADASKDIQIYINSPGGSVYAGLGIYDTMQFIKPDVATICTGIAASMAAIILCAGEKGKRSGLTHSRVMIHQPLGGMQGQVSDMEISYKLIKQMQKELYEILADRKSVVEGKSVDLGGRRIIKKKKKTQNKHPGSNGSHTMLFRLQDFSPYKLQHTSIIHHFH